MHSSCWNINIQGGPIDKFLQGCWHLWEGFLFLITAHLKNCNDIVEWVISVTVYPQRSWKGDGEREREMRISSYTPFGSKKGALFLCFQRSWKGEGEEERVLFFLRAPLSFRSVGKREVVLLFSASNESWSGMWVGSGEKERERRVSSHTPF